jgi:hypothetical protein
MGFKDIIAKLKGNDSKYDEYAADMRVAEKYEERKLSANERELQRFMKEEREDNIKEELDEFRKKRRDDIEYGHQILNTKNMFAPEANTASILRQKNLFTKKYKAMKNKGKFMK